ncbi:SAVMC3_10250 family protein [Streptomyces sp. NPDC047525]|uniref:DUF7019 family protein n=1 Tax=Streptomyces sp. NPDC047525 TaxID=3155264 RepID=UPI0033EBCF3B
MRYYIYVSTAKVDMLYGQIPPKLLRRLAVEAKVDLKVVSVAVQSSRTDTSAYDRLDLVETYLEREFDVSWMSEPTAWFRGDLALRIAGYGDANGPTLMMGADGDTLVALIGSAHHLIGYQVAPDMPKVGFSGLPSMFGLLRDFPPEWEPQMNVRWRGRGFGTDSYSLMREVAQCAEALTVPPVHCEFLARQLMRGTVMREDGRELAVVIGTPMYVAMSDRKPGDDGEA